MWFNKKHIKLDKIIELEDIQGYVLPHAGTKYTGEILSHTLRFKPKKLFDNILIMYYPVSDKPNVKELYYHEYQVVWKSLKYVIEKYWLINDKINFIPFNLRENYNENVNFEKNNESETKHYITSLENILLMKELKVNTILRNSYSILD